MGGLAGAIAWNGHVKSSLDLQRVHQAMAPYGTPAVWRGPVGDCELNLAAYDNLRPSSPASALSMRGDGAIVACSFAHLHDRRELDAHLGLAAGASVTDTDRIIAAYEKWGEACLDRLTGEFVFALSDNRRGGLLLGRDHAGSRQLAIYERDGFAAFATTALALTGVSGVGHELDLERAAEVIVLGYGTDRTFVKGVRTLPPGHAMWIDRHGSRTWRWWSPEEPVIRDLGSLTAHAEELRSGIEAAVRSSIDGAPRVGVFLSGGLDSSSVAAMAATVRRPAEVISYTSVPPRGWDGPVPHGWIASERPAVEALATMHPNLKPRFLDSRGLSMFEHAEALWELGAGPERNPLNMIWWYNCMRDAAVDGVNVLLTGSAGNQAFSADGRLWLAELAKRGRLGRVWREATRWSQTHPGNLLSTLRGQLLWPLLPLAMQERRATRTGDDLLSEYITSTAILPQRLQHLDLTKVLAPVSKPHPKGWTRDVHRMFDVSAAQAENTHALSTLLGIEVRDPTADRRMMEAALRQPEWWRRHDGAGRAVCRAAMRDLLPTEIVDNRFPGSQLPDWFDRMTDFKTELHDEIEQMRDHPGTREVVDVDKLVKLHASWPQRTQMADKQTIKDYQLAMSRAVMVSRYMRWFEGRARRVAAGGSAAIVHQVL